jgi:RNA polymerase sigma-70 factor (ECF subfamily)
MSTTPVSLLRKLRQPDDQEAWTRFVRLYSPFLYRCARRQGVPENDALDLVQDTFLLLVRKLPTFEYDPERSFRGWLRTILRHLWKDRLRRQMSRPTEQTGGDPEDPVVPSFEEIFADQEYHSYIARRALQIMRTDFQPQTWQACWEHAVEGFSAPEVARRLGVSPSYVYVATYRVLARLRQELDGFLD